MFRPHNNEAITSASCPLAELEKIQVRVGGISKASFGDNGAIDCFALAEHRLDGRFLIAFNFRGAASLMITAVIGPVDDFDYTNLAELDNQEPDALLEGLREIARRSPEVMIEFVCIDFDRVSIAGALELL
jgi:hypothetical protein